MKTKILIFIAFCVFFVGIYLAYFKDQNNYKQERQKDYICLMKNANESLYEQLRDYNRERARSELKYDYTQGHWSHAWLKINDLTKKFMNENQQDFSFDRLKNYIKQTSDILIHYNAYKFLVEERNFSLPEIPTKAFEKFSVLEKKLCYELIKMKIYECEKNSGRWLRVAYCGGRTLDSYAYERF